MEKITELFLKIYPLEGVSVKRRVLLHCVFWLMMFVCFWKSINIIATEIAFHFITTSYHIITSIIFFYGIVYLVAPLWDNNHKYKYLITILYVVIFVGSLAIIFYIRTQLIFDYNFLKGINGDASYLLKFYNNFWFIFESRYIITAIFTISFNTLPAFFIKLTRTLIKNISEKKQIEIDYLRTQINPHFLSNTLKNIYNLTIGEDKRHSDAILSLNGLLDYVLYEAKHSTISLEREIEFLHNFIALEKIRSSEKLKVSFRIEGFIHGNIPPMMLITFIENAFKHSIEDLKKNCFINIYMKVDENRLHFEVENSNSNLIINTKKKTFGGIGLTNIKKQLEILFPNTHYLQIIQKEDLYITKLQLELM